MDGRLWPFLAVILIILPVTFGYRAPEPEVEVASRNLNETELFVVEPVNKTDHSSGIAGFRARWEHLYPYFVFTLMLMMASMVRVVSVLVHIDKILPESCALLIFGVGIGAIFYAIKPSADKIQWAIMTYDRFFLILLPPIILEAAYNLDNREFFNKFLEINLLAIVGTLLNIILVFAGLQVMGGLLVQFSIMNDFDWLHLVLFSTIVAAVDPVAVLSIFSDLHINSPLYFIVFGESILNDAVVVTIYEIVEETVNSGAYVGWSYIWTFTWRMVVSYLGGFAIGSAFGIVTAGASRLTRVYRKSEPVIVLSLAYGSYIIADLCHTSGIVALTSCGLIQTVYVRHNLAEESNTTIHNLVEIMAVLDEIIIFFLLGIALINNQFTFDAGFVLWSVVFCTIGRFLSVFFVIAISNRYINRSRPVNLEETVLVSFAGLRGAIAFSLVGSLDIDRIRPGAMFQTTTLFVIAFTTFVFGISSKYLAFVLRIRTEEDEPKMTYVKVVRQVIGRSTPLIESFGTRRTFWVRNSLDFIFTRLTNWLVIGGSEKVMESDDPFHINEPAEGEMLVKVKDLDTIVDVAVSRLPRENFSDEIIQEVGMSEPEVAVKPLKKIRQMDSEKETSKTGQDDIGQSIQQGILALTKKPVPHTSNYSLFKRLPRKPPIRPRLEEESSSSFDYADW